MKILAIDPGNIQSAYAVLEPKTLRPLEFGKIGNEHLRQKIEDDFHNCEMAIEMIASYGMAVGVSVFETVFWIGRFWECAEHLPRTKIYRKEVKMNLCNSMRSKDANIRQALMDRFGTVGTKNNKGWFYGVSKDVWSAIAVGVTYNDLYGN